MFKLQIETKNAAFEEDATTEVIRILQEAILKLEQGNVRGAILRDINGNTVGNYTFTVWTIKRFLKMENRKIEKLLDKCASCQSHSVITQNPVCCSNCTTNDILAEEGY